MVRDDEDDTEYLLRSPANRKHLLDVLADIEKGERLVSVPAEKLIIASCKYHY